MKKNTPMLTLGKGSAPMKFRKTAKGKLRQSVYGEDAGPFVYQFSEEEIVRLKRYLIKNF
jgi:hypothetical protein